MASRDDVTAPEQVERPDLQEQTSPTLRRPSGPLAAVLTALVTGLLYFGAASGMLALADPVGAGAVFWPSAGVALASLLLTPKRWWPLLFAAIAIAVLASNLVVSHPLDVALWWTGGNLVVAAAGAALVDRLGGTSLSTVRSVSAFVIGGVVIAPVLGGVLGAVGTVAAGSGHSFGTIVARWAVGDGLGVLTVAPVGFVLFGDGSRRRILWRLEMLAILVVVVVTAVLVFAIPPWPITLPYLVLLPMLWAAVRGGVAGAAAAGFLVAQVANVSIALGDGPWRWTQAPLSDSAWQLQLFLLAATLAVLVLGTRSGESEAHRARAAGEQQMRERSEAMQDLGQLAVSATSHEQLAQQACRRFEPLVGPQEAKRLLRHRTRHAETASDELPPVLHEAIALLDVAHRRIEAERELAAINEQLGASAGFSRLLLDSTAEGLYGVDLAGRCTFANRACVQLLGYNEPEELVGRNMHALIHHSHPDGTPYPPESCRIYEGFRRGQEVASEDEVFFRSDGSSIPVAYRSHPIIQDGDVVGAVLTFSDISARLEAERRLEHSQALQQLAGEMARVGGWSIDLATNRVWWTKEMYEILEHPGPQGQDAPVDLAVYPPEHRERVETALRECAASGTPFDLKLEALTYRGHRLWVRVIARPQLAPDGRRTHVLGAFQDITAFQAATDEARDLAHRLSSTLESITDAFLALDQDWRFTYLNDQAQELLRRTEEELLGQSIWEQFPDLLGTEVETSYRRAMRDGVTSTVDDFYYPPLAGWFEIRAYPSSQGLTVYFRDVTDAHRAARALRERELKLAEQAALLDKARDAIIVRDLQHRVTYWNSSAERIYGWRSEEAIGSSIRELLYDGPEPFDIATAATLTHGDWTGELTQLSKDGDPLLVEARWTLVRDQDGEPRSVLAINSDITDKKRFEQQLLRAQRMESIGTLAGGIAHDLNNVLAPILLSAQTMRMGDLDERSANMCELIEKSTLRGSQMVRQVLSFARGLEGQRAELDLASLLEEVVVIARDTFPKSITIIHEPEPDPWSVVGDVTQLHQVLMNLCINARDAMPDGGSLRASVANVRIEERSMALDQQIDPGDYVCVTVEDNGIGMPPAVIDRIFEPFFTTKSQHEGTGLGLSTSRGIISSHGGFFKVYSEPGAGTSFKVYLPAAEHAATPHDVSTIDDTREGEGELVLLVDDEPVGRQMAREVLETHGYRVIEARDGTEAIPLFDEYEGQASVILTDLMMPNMDGPTTIRALLDRLPDVPVIAMSGLTSSQEHTRAAGLGVNDFLVKPFGVTELLDAVGRALATGPKNP